MGHKWAGGLGLPRPPVGSRGKALVGGGGGGGGLVVNLRPKIILKFQEPSISLLLKFICTYLGSISIGKLLSNTKVTV